MKTYNQKQSEHEVINNYLMKKTRNTETYFDRGCVKYSFKGDIYRYKIKDKVVRLEKQLILIDKKVWSRVKSYPYKLVLQNAKKHKEQ